MSLPVAADNRYGPEYLALRLLKRERGVATFLAEEASSGTAVVIKATSTARLTHEAQMRLEHEIAMLHAVDATLLAAPSHAGRRGDEAAVLRPYVDGIDGEFIQTLAGSETDRLMVQAMVKIAQNLGKSTIAEFVGDAPTQELLRGYGIDYAQGYHVGHPVDILQIAQ